jgi:hypothetical protein
VVLDNLSAHRAPRGSRATTDGALDATNRRRDAVHARRTNCPMNVNGRPARVTAQPEY